MVVHNSLLITEVENTNLHHNCFDHNLIVSILEKNICTFFAPPDGIIEANYKSNDKPVVIQKTLSSEQVQQLEGTGAGAALQNALRDWGYAK